MPAKIAAEEKKIKAVFSDDYLFEIPSFQRPYSWTIEQVDDLISDLLNAMQEDHDAPYFLGSIVLIKSDQDASSDVVDGQQRLTTLTMLICVLRELLNQKPADELDAFVREKGNFFKGTEDRFRLRLRDRDREFFQTNVQQTGKLNDFLQANPEKFSDTRRQVYENVKRLHERLSNLDDEMRIALAAYVTHQCSLVVVSTSDADIAYRVFSVLNARGLDLSPTDVLKADVLGKVPETDKANYTGKWENIEEEIGRSGFLNLFAHIRTIYAKERQSTILRKEFTDHVLSNLNAKVFVDEVLEPYAHAYFTISHANYQSQDKKLEAKINILLAHLNRLEIFDWMPPAMFYFNRTEDHPDQFCKFIQDLERLAYGFFVLKYYSTQRQTRYAYLLRDIAKNNNVFDNSTALQLSRDEQTEILKRLDGDIYNGYSRGQPRILLLRLDSLLADVGVTYDRSVISVEHVLPQNPSQSWDASFPDQKSRNRTHSLANLVLLSRRKNAKASNLGYQEKVEEYFKDMKTTFALTNDAIQEKEWTPDILERRQRKLIGMFKKEWRLEGP